MSLYVKALSKEDKENITGPSSITTALLRESHSKSLCSHKIFNSSIYTHAEDGLLPLANQNVRSRIKFHCTIPNPIFVGSKSTYIEKFFALADKNVTLSDILSCSKILDIDTNSLVSPDDSPAGNYLFGAEILKYYLSQMDLEETRVRIVYKHFAPFLPKSIRETFSTSDITTTKTDYPIVGKFYLVENVGGLIQDYTDLRDDFLSKSFPTTMSDIKLALNLKSLDELDILFMDDIMVLPIEMRPPVPVGNNLRHDSLTKKYAEITRISQNIPITKISKTAKAYASEYQALYAAVKSLQLESSINEPRSCILDRVKSKEGHIRSNVLGKRIDFSGRSVITVNPNLNVDHVGIPRCILANLFIQHLLRELSMQGALDNTELVNICSKYSKEQLVDKMIALGIFNKVPIIIGRQPTLHKLSMQAYWVVPTNGQSIEISPLVTGPFNADFDGDTFWCFPPLTEEAIGEVKSLMLNMENIFNPKDGKCVITPKQEIVYGLNRLTIDTGDNQKSIPAFSSKDELLDAVFNHRINPYDLTSCEGLSDTAGRLVFHFLTHKIFLTQTSIKLPIAKASIDKLVSACVEYCTEDLVSVLSNIARWGFRMAYFYPPKLTLYDKPDFKDAFAKFHEATTILEKYKNVGLLSDKEYESQFDSYVDTLQKTLDSEVLNKLDPSNGFLQLVTSGARGSKSNLIQIFASKGQIAKNNTEKFSFVIENSLSNQLTPLESLIAAYGGRKGHIDKNLNVSDTGYDSRKMYLSMGYITINSHDCGTDEGLILDKNEMIEYCKDEATVIKRLQQHLIGRYLAKPIGGVSTDTLITTEIAKKLVDDPSITKIEIRSPIKCKDQCCAKCYGVDLTTHKVADVGYPCGYAASHSIGEPSTQLTMNTFHSGGVAGSVDVVSNYSRVSTYLNASSNSSIAYDPVAWASGNTSVEIVGNKRKVKIESSSKSVFVPLESGPIKPYVEKGERMHVTPGDCAVKEYLAYNGLEKTQRFLLFQMFNLFIDEVYINLKHFEILVAAMTIHKCFSSNSEDYKVGCTYTTKYVNQHPFLNDDVYLMPTIVGLVEATRAIGPVSALLLEDQRNVLQNITLSNNRDTIDDPMVHIALGHKPNLGTNLNKNYRR